VSGVSGLSSGEVLLDGAAPEGWWLVVEDEAGSRQVVSGPFADRSDASLAAGPAEDESAEAARAVYGVRRPDGGLKRRPSPQDWAWLGHLGEQLDRLEWDDEVSEDDPLTTLVVEVTAALAEAGLPLHDPSATGAELGGACLSPQPALDGIVVTWRLHDRMSVDRVHGFTTDTLVQQVMNRAVADVLRVRGFAVESFGNSSSHVVRAAA